MAARVRFIRFIRFTRFKNIPDNIPSGPFRGPNEGIFY